MRPARKRTRVTLCRLDARDTAALTHEQATRPRHRRPERQEDRGRQAEPDTHRVSERHNGTVSISQQAPPPALRRAGVRLLHLQNISQTILSRADIAAFAQEHSSAFICGCVNRYTQVTDNNPCVNLFLPPHPNSSKQRLDQTWLGRKLNENNRLLQEKTGSHSLWRISISFFLSWHLYLFDLLRS